MQTYVACIGKDRAMMQGGIMSGEYTKADGGKDLENTSPMALLSSPIINHLIAMQTNIYNRSHLALLCDIGNISSTQPVTVTNGLEQIVTLLNKCSNIVTGIFAFR